MAHHHSDKTQSMQLQQHKQQQHQKQELHHQQQQSQEPHSINSTLVPLATFVAAAGVSLTLYSHSLYSDVPGGDAGELLAEACLLGAAHPPGYPLLLGLTHAWLKLCEMGNTNNDFLFASKFTCANMLNALFASLAAGFVALAVDEGSSAGRAGRHSGVRASQRVVAGVVGGVGFACAPLVWTYAIGFEVFALNNMLCAMLLWLTCRIVRLSQVAADRNLSGLPRASAVEQRVCGVLGAFVCGLALSNQHTAVLFEGPLIVCVSVTLFHARNLYPVEIGVAFCFGLTPYALLWYAGVHPQPGSWGDTGTFSGLVKHVLRQEYGTLRLSPIAAAPDQGWGTRMSAYLQDVTEQFSIPGVALAVGGCAHGIVLYLAGLYRRYRCGGAAAAAAASEVIKTSTRHHAAKSDRKDKRRLKKGSKAASSVQASHSPKTTLNIVPAHLPLVLAFLVYHGVFNGLANLPLDNAMAREVLRRFWMQPNLLFGVWLGIGVHVACGEQNSSTGNDSTSTSTCATSSARLVGGRRSLMSGMRTWVVMGLAVGWLSWHVQNSANALGLGRVELVLPTTTSSTSPTSFLRFTNATRHAVATGTVGRYARAILAPLPHGAIVLAHNDLNWNAARALQACQGVRPDVTYLSLQMMPYPWFATQQRPLYTTGAAHGKNEEVEPVHPQSVADVVAHRVSQPNNSKASVVFPALPAGMSTNRASRANLEQISRFATENLLHSRRPVFVDLHAVNDRDIHQDNLYADTGLRFVPEGLLFRVYLAQGPAATAYVEASNKLLVNGSRDGLAWLQPVSHALAAWQADTRGQVQRLREEALVPLAQLDATVYGEGTWERAAATMSWDALYQRALHLLTCAMSDDAEGTAAGGAKASPRARDDSSSSSDLLSRVAILQESAELLEELVVVEATAHTLTASGHDVQKNSALASVKLLQALSAAATAAQRRHAVEKRTGGGGGVAAVGGSSGVLAQLMAQKPRTRLALERFALGFPDDKDANTFRNIARSKALQDTLT